MMISKRLALALSVCFTLRSQSTPSSATFDAATIKVIDRFVLPRSWQFKSGGPGTGDPGRITWTRQFLVNLIAAAWDVDEELIAGPSWLGIEGQMFELNATMPPGTSRQVFQLMLQNLLVERFAAKLHHETRVYPGYELVVAKGGPKLKPAANPNAPPALGTRVTEYDPDGFPMMPPGHGAHIVMRRGGVFMRYQGFSMPEFIQKIAYWVREASGHPSDRVEDKTGLQGEFDFTLKFDNGEPAAVSVGPAVQAGMSTASDGPSASGPRAFDGLFKALEKQLGLQLIRSAKGFARDTIVIDHIEKVPIVE